MKWKFASFLVFFVFLSYSAMVANDRNASNLKIEEATSLKVDHKYDEAEKLLKEALVLDENNFEAVYELGTLYMLKQDFDTGIAYFEEVVKKDKVTDKCWQILGIMYKWHYKHGKAIETFQKGLEKFPESGALYYELGEMSEDSKELSTYYFEKGVEVQPEYHKNYFSLAFCFPEQEIWELIYGEIFINLGTCHSLDVVPMGWEVFNTYRKKIKSLDSTISDTSYDNHNSGNMKELESFLAAYEMTLSIAASSNITEDDLDLPTLIKIRTDFITYYYQNKLNEKFPNVLFEWHKKLIDEGFFEVYNYKIFYLGDPDVVLKWRQEHQEKLDEFMKWRESNRFPISKENVFLRKNNM